MITGLGNVPIPKGNKYQAKQAGWAAPPAHNPCSWPFSATAPTTLHQLVPLYLNLHFICDLLLTRSFAVVAGNRNPLQLLRQTLFSWKRTCCCPVGSDILNEPRAMDENSAKIWTLPVTRHCNTSTKELHSDCAACKNTVHIITRLNLITLKQISVLMNA